MLKCFLIFASLALTIFAEDDSKDMGTVIGIDLGTTYSWYVLFLKQNNCLNKSVRNII